jgi:hypothetical protein
LYVVSALVFCLAAGVRTTAHQGQLLRNSFK